MDITNAPEPYDSNEQHFSSFVDTSDTANITNFMDSEPSLPIEIHFIPNLPIPPLPSKNHLLSNYNIENWKLLIPKGIRPAAYFHLKYTL